MRKLIGTPGVPPTLAQVYIGKSDGTFALATLAHSGAIAIENGDGTITISSPATIGEAGAVQVSDGAGGFADTAEALVIDVASGAVSAVGDQLGWDNNGNLYCESVSAVQDCSAQTHSIGDVARWQVVGDGEGVELASFCDVTLFESDLVGNISIPGNFTAGGGGEFGQPLIVITPGADGSLGEKINLALFGFPTQFLSTIASTASAPNPLQNAVSIKVCDGTSSGQSTAATFFGDGSTVFGGTIFAGSFAVSSLPVGVKGQLAFASNARNAGEGAAGGSGNYVYFNSAVGAWCIVGTKTAVTA